MSCLTPTESARQSDKELSQGRAKRWNLYCGRIWSTLVWVRSVLRCLPLFFSERPKTPLRILGIMTFDALGMLRRLKPLSVTKRSVLAALLDFGGCTNAMLDSKDYCRKEIQQTRQILDNAGMNLFVEEFQRRLWDLERSRPRPLEVDWQFHKVRTYREAVIRLLLGTIATTASGDHCIDEGIRATYDDDDLKILFRIVMQFQIIDDVLDYSKDMSAGLPSFLTASKTLPEAISLTHQASLGYSQNRDWSRSGDDFPLRAALFFGSACAELMIQLCRWRLAAFNPTTSARPGSSRTTC